MKKRELKIGVLLQSARDRVADFVDVNWCMYCGYFNPTLLASIQLRKNGCVCSVIMKTPMCHHLGFARHR